MRDILESEQGMVFLLPCKKCGKDSGRLIHYHSGEYRVICTECSYCTKDKFTKEKAIKAWNQRDNF